MYRMALIHAPEFQHLTKETSRSRLGGIARTAARTALRVAPVALRVANVANTLGFVKHPYLKAGLKAANTAATFATAHPHFLAHVKKHVMR